MYSIAIILVLSVTKVVIARNSHVNKDDYVSQESGDLTEINEVIDSESKENNDNYEKGMSTSVNKVTVTELPATENESPTIKITTTIETTTFSMEPLENITSNYYNCEEKKTSSSSEEDRCKSTLVNYPYSVSIQKKGAHYASGALINAQSVLTTAGVFYHVREAIKLFRVRLGSVDCKKGGIIVPIKRVEIHPSYEFGKPSFDLALIKLARPVNITDFIKPIQLSKIKQGVVSAKFMTTYWPRLIVNGNVLPHTAKERVKYQSMRVSKQKLIPWKTCAAMMRARSAVLDETSLCLKPIATHHSVCMPDVGAPVVAEDGLWGITSGWTSKQCFIYPSPTILTRTAMPPVRTWLESVL